MSRLKETLGIGIFGAGNVSSGHLNAYLANPDCRVTAIGSRTLDGAADKAREVGLDPNSINLYDDIDAFLADPDVDALSICTPHARHAADVIAAANAGKHCLVEKPIAMDESELLAMDAAVSQAGTKTVCGFVLRFNPSIQATRAFIDQGLLGTPLYVQTDYWHNPEQSGYPGSENHLDHMDASAMMLGGCHAIDLARYLMGSDIIEVTAMSFTDVENPPFPPGQSALVRFANGKVGKVSASVEQWMPYQFNVDLLGTDGGLRDNRFYSRKLPGFTDWGTFPTILPNSGSVSHHPFQGEIDHFIDCILERTRKVTSMSTMASIPIERFSPSTSRVAKVEHWFRLPSRVRTIAFCVLRRFRRECRIGRSRDRRRKLQGVDPMIVTDLSRIREQVAMTPNLETAIRFLEESGSTVMPVGRAEIDGDRVYAEVQEYETISGPIEKLEGHRRYLDIQFVAEGEETIGWASIDDVTETDPFNKEHDYWLGSASADGTTPVALHTGQLALLYPSDMHAPRRATDLLASVRKLVVKVEIESTLSRLARS